MKKISELTAADFEGTVPDEFIGARGLIKFKAICQKFGITVNGKNFERIRTKLTELGWQCSLQKRSWFASKQSVEPEKGSLGKRESNTVSTPEDTSLFELQHKLSMNQLRRPLWQRSPTAWSEAKKDLFKKTMLAAMGRRGEYWLESTVTLFTHPVTDTDDDEIVFINDGLHRITCGKELFETMQLENGAENAKKQLEKIRVRTQKYVFSDSDALAQYIRVNQGTPLSPADLASTILTQEEEYPVWEPLMRKTEDMVRDVCKTNLKCRVETKPGVFSAQFSNPNFEREMRALLARTVSKTTDRKSMDFNPQGFLKGIGANTNLVEHVLARALKAEAKITAKDAVARSISKLDTMHRTLQSRATVWRMELDKIAGTTISFTPALARFMILATVHFENSNVSAGLQNNWFKTLICRTKGTSYVADKKCGITSQDLRNLQAIETELGCSIDPKATGGGRKKPKTILTPHIDHAHEQPYSETGVDSGKTFPQPSSENRAWGAKPAINPTSVGTNNHT